MANDMALLDWEPHLPPTDLIFDDGVPLESNRHRVAMNVLIDSALQALSSRSDVFTGGNMFVYHSRNQAMNRDFREPDFLWRWMWMVAANGRAGWCGKKRDATWM